MRIRLSIIGLGVMGLLLALSSLGVLMVAARGSNSPLQNPGGPYTTGYILQNTGVDTASVQIEYYNNSAAGGTMVYSRTAQIASNSALGINQAQDTGLISPFNGSIVASSSDPLLGIVSVGGPDQTQEAAYYAAFAAGAEQAYLPALYKNWFGSSTQLVVQNVTSNDDIPIYIHYIDRDGNEDALVTDSLKAFSSNYYRTDAVSGITDSNWAGSAIVTSTQDIAAVAINYKPNDIAAYNGYAGGETSAYLPALYKAFFGQTSGYIAQNVGSGPAVIYASYYNRGEITSFATISSTTPINQNVAWARNQAYHDTFLSDGWAGSVVLTSTQPIVAAVTNANASRDGESIYNGANSGSSDTTVYLPALYRNWFGATSGYIAQNIGSSSAVIYATYYDRGSATPRTTINSDSPIAPGGSWPRNQEAHDGGLLPSPWAGSVVITSTEPIAVIVLPDYTGATTAYNGQVAASP